MNTKNIFEASSYFNSFNVKVYCLAVLFLLDQQITIGQNVGINTNNPQRRLTVNGSIMLDQGNTSTGTLDSAALVFGGGGNAGIVSKKTPGGNTNGLSFFTSGVEQMMLSHNGRLGIGGTFSNSLRLWVHNGASQFDGDVSVGGHLGANGNAGIGGLPDNDYRLRVWGGNARIGGDFHATGNAALGGDIDPVYRLRVRNGNTRFDEDMYTMGNVIIGTGLNTEGYRLLVNNGLSFLNTQLRVSGNTAINGEVDNNFRFRVYGGNSRFGGDVEVTGNLNVAEINGTGVVRSNGSSSLRIGFDQRTVNQLIAANSAITVVANITDFSGDASDVRVMISQIDNQPGNQLFSENLVVNIVEVDAAANTCTLRIRNLSNVAATLHTIIYLTSIARD